MESGIPLRIRPRKRQPATVAGLLMAALVVSAAGCSQPRRQDTSSAAAGTSAQARYELKGKIISIDKPAKQLTVDHEAVPGFMGAMTMAYPVKDERALDIVSPGDHVTAKVVSSNGAYWLEEVIVTKHGPAR